MAIEQSLMNHIPLVLVEFFVRMPGLRLVPMLLYAFKDRPVKMRLRTREKEVSPFPLCRIQLDWFAFSRDVTRLEKIRARTSKLRNKIYDRVKNRDNLPYFGLP